MKHFLSLVLVISMVFGFAFADVEVDGSSSDVVLLSGSGVTICDPVTISHVPTRISFEQTEEGKFDVSCIYELNDYSVLDGYSDDIGGCTTTRRTGNYTFLVESDHGWTLTLEPLKHVEFESLAGTGDFVSDIYTFDKPVILTLNAKFLDGDNVVLHAYLCANGKWDSAMPVNETGRINQTEEYKTILKITEKSEVFFVLDFDHGEWGIDIT